MRALTLGLLASIAAAGIAQAAQIGPVADVQITFGKDIQTKPRIYGAKEKKHLETELREAVESKVGTSRSGGRLELTIEDAKPNRPTWTQQSFEPSISYARSYGIGGARITGARPKASPQLSLPFRGNKNTP